MIIKLRKQLQPHSKKPTNKVPNARSRKFLMNSLRARRAAQTSPQLRAALGFTHWLIAATNRLEKREAFRAECFITGRSRGTSQRFTISRTKVKEVMNQAKLFGVRKSSW